jgi:hypothetical protein
MCQWQKRLDPAYDTYDAGLGNYVYVNRLSLSNGGESLADFRTTGRIRRPLITVAGTMDALLPIDANARAYARPVAAAAREEAGRASSSPSCWQEPDGEVITSGAHCTVSPPIEIAKLAIQYGHANRRSLLRGAGRRCTLLLMCAALPRLLPCPRMRGNEEFGQLSAMEGVTHHAKRARRITKASGCLR